MDTSLVVQYVPTFDDSEEDIRSCTLQVLGSLTLAVKEDRSKKKSGKPYVQSYPALAYDVTWATMNARGTDSTVFNDELVRKINDLQIAQFNLVNKSRTPDTKLTNRPKTLNQESEKLVAIERYRSLQPALLMAINNNELQGAIMSAVAVPSDRSKHGLLIGVTLTIDPEKKHVEANRIDGYAITAEIKAAIVRQVLTV